MRRRGWIWLAAALVVVWVLGRGVDGGSSDSPSGGPARHDRPTATATESAEAESEGPAGGTTSSPSGGAARGTALAVLTRLAVKGRAPMTGYSREEFAQAWLDADRNGCDTRNDILRRDLVDLTFKPGTQGCVALTGLLHDPYTGQDLRFERGGTDGVDIDHVVALGNAWATGAARLSFRTRAALANDPLNLLAVDLHANRSKGDGDAATWLPPARDFRCAYVARQVAVKRKYRLWVTPAEHEALQRVLRTCPGQRVPPDLTRAPTTVDQNISPPRPSASAPLGFVAPGSVSYENCTAVRAAGAAPIHVGEPGYSRKLDRDGDGVACE